MRNKSKKQDFPRGVVRKIYVYIFSILSSHHGVENMVQKTGFIWGVERKMAPKGNMYVYRVYRGKNVCIQGILR